jgi:hypothetical protein
MGSNLFTTKQRERESLTHSTPYSIDDIAFLNQPRDRIPTILVLGDSVDRNGVTQFCQLMKGNLAISHYRDLNDRPSNVPALDELTTRHGPNFEGWDQRGLPHLCEIPRYIEPSDESADVQEVDLKEAGGEAQQESRHRPNTNTASPTEQTIMRVVNGFHYGMDDIDEFKSPEHGDWHRPGKFEDRLHELFLPMVEQLGGVDAIDVVQIQSGMWDVVRPSCWFLVDYLPSN